MYSLNNWEFRKYIVTFLLKKYFKSILSEPIYFLRKKVYNLQIVEDDKVILIGLKRYLCKREYINRKITIANLDVHTLLMSRILQ